MNRRPGLAVPLLRAFAFLRFRPNRRRQDEPALPVAPFGVASVAGEGHAPVAFPSAERSAGIGRRLCQQRARSDSPNGATSDPAELSQSQNPAGLNVADRLLWRSALEAPPLPLLGGV